MTEKERQRMLELLADQSAFGLNEEELSELKMYMNQFPERENDFSFDLTAAAIGLAHLDATEPLPENLRKKITIDAEQFFGATEKSVESKEKINEFIPQIAGGTVAAETKTRFWHWLGWAVAAAACVALAVNLWLTRFQKQTEVVKVPEEIQTPTPELTAAQKRERLIASAPDKIEANLTEAKPSGGEISGDVVWSSDRQEGYLRLRGLPVNNPGEETYQLWIVDETRNEKTPMSGGVFNVRQNGEIIVPIDPQLKVKKPKMFAITKEKSGGVVVSSPEKILAVAKI